MEHIVLNIQAFDKDCIGCRQNNSEIMISYTDKDGVNDLFITNFQAEKLIFNLQKCILNNKQWGV